MHQHCIDYRDIKPRVVEQPGHRRVVITCGFHHHTGLAVQAFEQPCQLAQFAVGVKYLKGRDYHLSKRAHDCNHALALRNIDANTVHSHPPNTKNPQPEPIFFSLPIQSIG